MRRLERPRVSDQASVPSAARTSVAGTTNALAESERGGRFGPADRAPRYPLAMDDGLLADLDPGLVLATVIAINLGTFVLFGWDKLCAIRRWWRVPELWLLVPSALTGAAGAWLATVVFRHKTQKTSFRVKLAVATLVNGLWVALAAGWIG